MDKTTSVSTRVSLDAKKALKRKAEESESTISQLLRRLIKKTINGRK